MKKVDLGQDGDGPYRYDFNLLVPGGIEGRETEFHAQVFAENGKGVFLLSDTPQNYAEPDKSPLDYNMPGATTTIMQELGLRDLNSVEVIYHQPENVTGNNPEKFETVHQTFDLNGLREDGLRPRQELTADQVAERIGPENFQENLYAQEATATEEVAAQPDYARADLAAEQFADNATGNQNLRDLANEYEAPAYEANEYEPQPQPEPQPEVQPQPEIQVQQHYDYQPEL